MTGRRPCHNKGNYVLDYFFMPRTGDVYLIPLLPGKQALATVLGLGAPSWNPGFQVMLIGAYNCLVAGSAPTSNPGTVMKRYWCECSFIQEGNWSLVRHIPVSSEKLSAVDSVWGTHELFLDDLRQNLGLERQTYTGAEFTFSEECAACGGNLHQGFARCPNCRAIREEFRGLERFVADQPGICCLSAAVSDVRDADGQYYWAPYFIDRVRAGEVPSAPNS